MELQINSRHLGKVVTFFRSRGGHIFADLNGKVGNMGSQLCDGGKLMGWTLECTEDAFERVARNWWAAYLKNQRI